MKFLLTNDDGITAEGLAALQRAVADYGEVAVVAPRDHLSGCSHRVTTDVPLAVSQKDEASWSVDGSPADCTRLGLLHLADDADWVLSGINAGGNLGVDVHMSGTVAAVREAALLGKPAIAFSQYRARRAPFDWKHAERLTREVLGTLIEKPQTTRTFWNVNLPDPVDCQGEPQLRFCVPDSNPLAVAYVARNETYLYRGRYQDRQRESGSDVDICFGGHIAVSKLASGFTSGGS